MCWTTTLYHVLVHTHALSLVCYRINVHFSKCIFWEFLKVRKIKLSAKYVTHALKRMKKERARHATVVAQYKPRSDLRSCHKSHVSLSHIHTHTHSIWTRPQHMTRTHRTGIIFLIVRNPKRPLCWSLVLDSTRTKQADSKNVISSGQRWCTF